MCCLIAAAAAAAAPADLPYAGKWKMNPAKSDFGESTMTLEQLQSGEMQSTAAGQSYKFKLIRPSSSASPAVPDSRASGRRRT
jgi:hypothetical protein